MEPDTTGGGHAADVSILTVNYHSAPALAESQRALARRMPRCDFEWIVVNHSPDERVAPVAGLEKRTRILEQPNSGFAGGINAAARVASAPVLVLANPDLVFDGPLLDGGLERLGRELDVGLLGPRLTGIDGEPQHSARRFYRWSNVLFARFPGRDRLQPPASWRRHLMLDDDLAQPTDVDWLLGAALFVRRLALRDRAKVFDPRYFLYFEDVDLCMDLWSRGWKVRFDPTLVARHVHVRASRSIGTHAAWLHAKSFLSFVRKWDGLPARPVRRTNEALPSDR
jgi:GT2 family glycosyltransferase